MPSLPSHLLMPFLLCGLSACSVHTSGSPAVPAAFGAPDTRELKTATDPLAGTVEGKAWTSGQALAHVESNGELRITIAQAGETLSCTNDFPLSPHVTFVVANQKGVYPYDGSQTDARLVNVIFPDTTSNGGGSDNVLSSKSLIQIDQVQAGVVSGSVSALSPIGESHSYEIAGRFQATICGVANSSPLAITIKGAPAFDIVYSEAIKSQDASGAPFYQVRVMNKVPASKCNNWSAWMMTEVPIKYFTVWVPAKVGPFAIAAGKGMEYGSEGTSGGWATKGLEGTATVQELTSSQINVAVEAKDVSASGVAVSGFVKATLCADGGVQ